MTLIYHIQKSSHPNFEVIVNVNRHLVFMAHWFVLLSHGFELYIYMCIPYSGNYWRRRNFGELANYKITPN